MKNFFIIASLILITNVFYSFAMEEVLIINWDELSKSSDTQYQEDIDENSISEYFMPSSIVPTNQEIYEEIMSIKKVLFETVSYYIEENDFAKAQELLKESWLINSVKKYPSFSKKYIQLLNSTIQNNFIPTRVRQRLVF